MSENKLIPAGYQYFVENLELKVMPHFRQSYITTRGISRVEINHGPEQHIYTKSFLPENTLGGQLEFALKYDGINLEILKEIFKTIPENEMVALIQSRPTSKYVRKIWFLYEFLLDRQLPIHDATIGNYVDLLPEEKYFTSSCQKSSRHRINNNLLGNPSFCPMIRKTIKTQEYMGMHLSEKAAEIFRQYPADIAYRANQFLYFKETKSSFAIEREQPDLKRTTRFVEALREIENKGELTKSMLIDLQNTIVDERFADVDYRQTQNYVGESIAGYRQRIHYISPSPEDLPTLMEGFLALVNLLQNSGIDPVATAATCAFAFVYLHPFEDGNGRIHRLLIHYLLVRTGFTPHGVIFPVSSVMLAELRHYDDCLESFSKPLLSLIDYTLHDDGSLSVNNQTADFYRYFDASEVVEYLYEVIKKTIEVDLVQELEFITNYDHAKKKIQDVIDMPDKKIDLLIKLALENHGVLSKSKRNKFFDFLTDIEVRQLEAVIKDCFEL